MNQLALEFDENFSNDNMKIDENIKENDFFMLISFKVSKLKSKLNGYILESITQAIFVYFVWFNNYFVLNENLISKVLTLRDVDLIIDLIYAKLVYNSSLEILTLFYHVKLNF